MKARTKKQGLALAYGKSRHRWGDGYDWQQVERRVQAGRQNDAKGLETCWHCNAGHALDAKTCPACGEPTLPF